MRNLSSLLTCVSMLFVCLALPLSGQVPTGKIVTVTDEFATMPGQEIISDYYSVLPPANKTSRTTQMAGWPVTIGTDPFVLPQRGMVFADLDNNGTKEIITSSTNSNVYAWDYTGAVMPGFPVSTTGYCQSPPLPTWTTTTIWKSWWAPMATNPGATYITMMEQPFQTFRSSWIRVPTAPPR